MVGKVAKLHDIIQRMKEQETTIRVGLAIADIASKKGQTFLEWYQDCLDLAGGIDRGRVYRLIGEDFEQIKITDIKPYMEESMLKRHNEFVIWPSTFKDFVNKAGGDKDLALRLISLGLLADNLHLYYLDEETDLFDRIEFSLDPEEKW